MGTRESITLEGRLAFSSNQLRCTDIFYLQQPRPSGFSRQHVCIALGLVEDSHTAWDGAGRDAGRALDGCEVEAAICLINPVNFQRIGWEENGQRRPHSSRQRHCWCHASMWGQQAAEYMCQVSCPVQLARPEEQANLQSKRTLSSPHLLPPWLLIKAASGCSDSQTQNIYRHIADYLGALLQM